MKRAHRDPETFDTLELFSALSPIHGYQINSQKSIDDFATRVKESLLKSQQKLTTLHGKRIESLFAHVAGAMGETILITNEDRGSIISTHEDITPPDYRITLKNGHQIFVEVKNHNSHDITGEYTLDKDYVKKLESHSHINNTPLYFAIYFRIVKRWVILNSNDFAENESKLRISIINAMARSKMNTISS